MNFKKYTDRFFEILKDKILLFKYRNRPYIEYYRAVMKRNTAANPKSAVGAPDSGQRQLERLRLYGLKPEHTLFDLGCGSLRGGLYLINHLNDGNYWGNDISQEILQAAQEFLEESGLARKHPHLFYTNNIEFDEVKGKTFDYIHAQSVLSHMPPEDIEILFKNVSRIMHPGTQFLASHFPSKTGEIYPSNQRRNFHYPFTWMKKAGARYGLKVELTPDVKDYSGKQPIMRITLA